MAASRVAMYNAREVRRLMRLVSVQIPGLILAVAVTACGGCGSSPPPPHPVPAPMPTPVATTPPLPAVPPPCDQAQYLAASTSMQARAAAEAPGMKPEGTPICGVAGPGQTVVGPMFMLEPGYCYTFLGQSLPPVVDMEMSLLLDASGAVGSILPPNMGNYANMAQAPLLVSTTPGERISMAEKKSCYQAAVPGPVKLLLKARSGGGPVAAQVFRKKTM
jgi:hypothetical protein